MFINPPSPSGPIVKLRTMASPFKKGRNVFLLLFFSFALSLSPSSSQSSDLFKYHQVAMGTAVEITLMGDNEEQANKAALQAFQEIKLFDS